MKIYVVFIGDIYEGTHVSGNKVYSSKEIALERVKTLIEEQNLKLESTVEFHIQEGNEVANNFNKFSFKEGRENDTWRGGYKDTDIIQIKEFEIDYGKERL